jgi:hypothetical protein
MTAPVDALGDIHAQLAETYKRMISPREEVIFVKGEPLLDDAGQPVTQTVYPSAAELQAANAFLRDNKITAAPQEGSALDELQQLMQKRHDARAKRPAVLADPYATLPNLQ